jgi:hypothetical protein
MRRAAWWEKIESECRFSFDRATARPVVAELRQTIPYPTMPELADYVAHKQREEREADARLAPLKAAFPRALQARDE